jgi:hypothetical protein
LNDEEESEIRDEHQDEKYAVEGKKHDGCVALLLIIEKVIRCEAALDRASHGLGRTQRETIQHTRLITTYVEKPTQPASTKGMVRVTHFVPGSRADTIASQRGMRNDGRLSCAGGGASPIEQGVFLFFLDFFFAQGEKRNFLRRRDRDPCSLGHWQPCSEIDVKRWAKLDWLVFASKQGRLLEVGTRKE